MTTEVSEGSDRDPGPTVEQHVIPADHDRIRRVLGLDGLLFERMGDAVLVADDEGRYLDANPAAELLLGRSRDALTKMQVSDLVIEIDATAETMWSHFRDAGALTGRVWLRRADGEHVVCDYHATADVAPGIHVSILRDVTAVVAAGEAERAADLRFRSVLDSLGLLAVVARPDGQVQFVNPAVTETFDLDDDPTSQPLPEPLATPGLVAALTAARAGAADAPNWVEEVTLPDGRTRLLDWTGAFVRDAAGDVESIVAIGEDVTDRHDAEARGRRASRMASITRLAGGVAHDFNNLLTVITGHLELLDDLPDLPDHARQHLQQIELAAGRATALAGQLLAFGRRQQLRPDTVSIADTLEQTVATLTRVVDERIHVDLALLDRDAIVSVDTNRFSQAIVDLVLYAAEASPDSGRLGLTLDRVLLEPADATRLAVGTGPYARLEITDEGSGIEPEVLEHVFEPFVAGQTAAVGGGLGLASAYGVVAQSGGSITVSSTRDVGTRFTILLPEIGRLTDEYVRRAHADANSSLERPDPAMTTDERPTGSVLLVDDDPAVRRVIEQILIRAGWAVEAHGDGRTALLALSDRGHDLMITDLVMPAMDGRELVERARTVRPDLPVLLVTGLTGDLMANDAAADGAFDVEVLHKPFNAQQLLAGVRRVVSASTAS